MDTNFRQMTFIYTFKCFEKNTHCDQAQKYLKKNIYKQSKRMTTFEYSIVPKKIFFENFLQTSMQLLFQAGMIDVLGQ